MVGIRKIVILFLFWTLGVSLPASGYAQSPPNASGYSELFSRRSSLHEKQDSIQTRLTTVRKLFSSDQSKQEEYGVEIIRLERELFGLRDRINSLGAEIKKYEDAGVTPETFPHDKTVSAGRDASQPCFVSTDYIRNSLPEEEYGQLKRSQEAERVVASQLAAVKYNYELIAGVDSLYARAERGQRADSLFLRMSRLSDANDALVKSLSETWMKVFDYKIYAYNYILDKDNRAGILSDMERAMRELVSETDEVRGEYMYDAVAFYPLQKELILEYEIRIADDAGLKMAADSLRAISRTLDERSYFLPYINTEERIFIDYSDYTVSNPPVYNNSNPIPATEIHSKGTVFRVFVGAFSQPQPISTFRNVSPVSREVKDDKRHYYYIGGYRTMEEADAAAARLKTHGFRNPRVVVWVDGVYSDKPSAAQTVGGKNTPKTSYRIEIRGVQGALSQAVTSLIRDKAPGKEISRVNDQETGKQLFTVGFFDKQAVAEALMNEIAETDRSLDIRIKEIE